jgi:hypothetical protein
MVAQMVRLRSDYRSTYRYGLGVWLHKSTDTVFVEGSDIGVSFHSVCDPFDTNGGMGRARVLASIREWTAALWGRRTRGGCRRNAAGIAEAAG